jgi:di/tricarboxylate transporter
MTPIAWTGAIIAGTMVLFIWNRVPVTVVAIGSALALWATGIVTLPEALQGFGDTSVVFIASLFVVSSALDATGVTAWVGQKLVGDPGTGGFPRLLMTLMLLAAGLTALISANGAVAALLPVASVAAIRLSVAPSRVLLPLAFAAHAGSNLVLTGAPKNVLVSDALLDAGMQGFGYLEFALVGVPLVIGTVIIVRLFGGALLPERTSRNMPADLSRHARVLVEQYGLASGTFKLRVREGSPLAGRAPSQSDLLPPGLRLVSTLAGAHGGPVSGVLAAGDMLMVQGEPAMAAAFAEESDLSFRDLREDGGETLLSRNTGLAEIVIPPRSALVGRQAFPGMITPEGDLVILAIQRNGQDVAEGGIELAPGDTILLQGTWKALDQRLGTPEVLIVDSPDLVRRQAVPLGAGARIALGTMGGMVVLLATGLVPPAVAGLLAAGVLLVSGVVSLDAAHRSINWTTVILVGAMMPLSLAMERTGAAQLLADGLVTAAGPLGPTALLAGLFVLTATLGQIMSNTATTLIVIPVALAAAVGMGVSPRPVMMSLCVAGAASFMTPVATSTNLMVMGPGGYKFGDYWRLGTPLMALYFVVAVFLVPLIWRF